MRWNLVLIVTVALIAEVDREERDGVSSEVLVQNMKEQKMDLPLTKKQVKKHFPLFMETAHVQYNPNFHLLASVDRPAPFLISLSSFYIVFLEKGLDMG